METYMPESTARWEPRCRWLWIAMSRVLATLRVRALRAREDERGCAVRLCRSVFVPVLDSKRHLSEEAESLPAILRFVCHLIDVEWIWGWRRVLVE